MSNRGCTTERNCGYAIWNAQFHRFRSPCVKMNTTTMNVCLRVLDSKDKRNSRIFQLKDVPRFLVWTAYCLRLYIASHKKFRNIALNCFSRMKPLQLNAEEHGQTITPAIECLHEMKAASFTSLDSWLFTINIQTHRSFRSYNLRSTIAIRRSLRQSFLKKVYLHILRKLNIGTAGVAISTDGQQIASNENSIIMCFQQGTGFRLCFTHVNAIFHSIFHKFLYRFTQNLFACKRT